MTSTIAKAELKFFEQVSVIYDCHSKVFSQCGIILKLPCKVYEEFDEEYRHCFTITNSTKVGGLSGREADMNGFIYLLPDFVCYFIEE